jgi:GT2 family glycosyltransferase
MSITVIISYYKALNNLKLILKALSLQSCSDFDVIISEDDNNLETVSFLFENEKKYSFKIHHLFQQEDLGFRKNLMLNRGVSLTKSDNIVFIDGDCVPHKHFVRSCKKMLKQGVFLSGRSVMLDEKTTEYCKINEDLTKLKWSNLIFTKSKKVKESIYWRFFSLSFKNRGLVGRNWGVKKEHLLQINGFDEDYVKAGVGEDVDIEWRLLSIGLKRKMIKNKAIVFHLYHKKVYSEVGVSENYKLLENKIKENNIVCLKGISKS